MEYFLTFTGFAILMFVVFQLEGILKNSSDNKVKIAEANRDKATAELAIVREQNNQVTR